MLGKKTLLNLVSIYRWFDISPNSLIILYDKVWLLIVSFFYKFIYLIYLFLAALGLRCCAQTFSSCGERGLLFVVVRGLLIVMASLVAEHGF